MEVPYKVTINRDQSVATWDGEIMLKEGTWHRLRGGVVVDVDADAVSATVMDAFEREVETLNLEELSESYAR
jgi:hypothetical protein